MEEEGRDDGLRVLPGSAPSVPYNTDPDDSGQVLALPPNRAGRELPQPISAEMKLAPFDRPLRNSRNRATGY